MYSMYLVRGSSNKCAKESQANDSIHSNLKCISPFHLPVFLVNNFKKLHDLVKDIDRPQNNTSIRDAAVASRRLA